MLHIIAGEKSAAYDGALFAILLPIFLFFLIVVWLFCVQDRAWKQRKKRYMWRCSSFSLEFFHSASFVSWRFRSENTQPGEVIVIILVSKIQLPGGMCHCYFMTISCR